MEEMITYGIVRKRRAEFSKMVITLYIKKNYKVMLVFGNGNRKLHTMEKEMDVLLNRHVKYSAIWNKIV